MGMKINDHFREKKKKAIKQGALVGGLCAALPQQCLKARDKE
jgi:hypothetical protein